MSLPLLLNERRSRLQSAWIRLTSNRKAPNRHGARASTVIGEQEQPNVSGEMVILVMSSLIWPTPKL